MDLYRKILCKDRLPVNGGEYITNLGNMMLLKNPDEWVNGNVVRDYPAFWMGKLSLPITEMRDAQKSFFYAKARKDYIGMEKFLPEAKKLEKEVDQILGETRHGKQAKLF